ncbi:universal stress protein Usp [Geotalea daltonii FRC-32]|uniref:Universal stress protein n=1 Tax=Geotalea daltonii (strain DSM 22248 / JCM 15807 / FRC-32) TaxID=316067 RepID=B9M686_GEODF|nr:universal stress protein [Geotalea daltonii]ACM21874.1 universal stress protein Usp [Geotalea daltonii FRC-32]
MTRLDKILFATDFSENSEHAFEYAYSFARKFESQLLILHVINEPVDLRGFYVPHVSFDNLEKEIEEGAEKMMEKFCRTRIKEETNYKSSIVMGIPYEEILKKAEEESVSLIVLGTQGRSGIDHLLFGSTAERVVRKAKCPVMTVRLP